MIDRAQRPSFPSRRLPGIAAIVLPRAGTLWLSLLMPFALHAALVDESQVATAELSARSSSMAAGKASFTSAGKQGIRIVVEMSGLDRRGRHGMHIHKNGDCSAPDAASAGPHFALESQRHGSGKADGHHAGDLGNIEADADGRGRLEVVVPSERLTLGSGPLSVVGKALVVHAGPDDLTSQPAGDSGSRIACGLIERVKVDSGGPAPAKP